MTQSTRERIAFNVETSRVLEILASEIYDSPYAFLRENVQNAYDAILMRCQAEDLRLEDRRIEITVADGRLTVFDDGIGMSEEVLRSNFWEAGSSGKKTEFARSAGVIGTFGIGAMANFGVCTLLRVETRYYQSDATLISWARREDLSIAQECVELERIFEEREAGTLIVAELDSSQSIDAKQASAYLKQYVRFLPVPVSVNNDIISREAFEDTVSNSAEGFQIVESRRVSRNAFTVTLNISVNDQDQILARATDISLHGSQIAGEVFLLQKNGSILAFRNFFGLAPVPVSSDYGLSGFVNLDILTPTAGREALSRESVQHIAYLVELIEAEASVIISETDAADTNRQFQEYIRSRRLTHLAHKVKIFVRPAEEMVALGDVKEYEREKSKYYYTGRDLEVLQRFAHPQSNLFHVSRVNPRRTLQTRYLSKNAGLEKVPEQTFIERIPKLDLTLEEAMFLLRSRVVLLDDYLMPNIDIAFAKISHGVAIHVEMKGDELYISIERGLPAVATVTEVYRSARDVFDGFIKDFVREHIYPHIRSHVPSSTKQGRDALYRRLKANRELYRLEEGDYGAIEELLSDYLTGTVGFDEVLRNAGRRTAGHRQHLSNEQIGTLEDEFPDIVDQSALPEPGDELLPMPPILRTDIASTMKVLTVENQYPRLNSFQMFLSVSDSMFKREGDFLRWPHTTKLIWGAHRVIYIFTDEIGEMSLYYDIELKTPLETEQTGGQMLATTTIMTKNRIYVPVPGFLETAFQVTDGTKEFYVRFDTIP
jgi:molecular chaperone HtpG